MPQSSSARLTAYAELKAAVGSCDLRGARRAFSPPSPFRCSARELVELLSTAVNSNCAAMVRCVLEQGANPNAIAKDERESPLMLVVRLPGGAPIVTALLEFGADPNRMIDGRTVLTHAAAFCPVANVRAILKSPKTLIDEPTREAETALGFAIVWHHHAMIEELLRHGASLQARDGGSTPLHLACGSASGDLRSVRLLLKHGAKLDALDSLGRTPLQCAIEGGYRAIAVLLARKARARGVKPNRMAKELSLAQERGWEDVARLLGGELPKPAQKRRR